MVITKIISLIILVAVIWATAVLQTKKETKWYVYALLQTAGLAALIAFGVLSYFTSFAYILLLTLILSSQSKGEKTLVRTTIYTWLLAFLLLLSRSNLNQFMARFWLDRPIENSGMIIFALIFSTISLIWFNFWTKTNNLLIYAVLVYFCTWIPKLLAAYSILHFNW